MRAGRLHSKRIAILVGSGFDQSQYLAMKIALEVSGAEAITLSPSTETRSWSPEGWGEPAKLDQTLRAADPTQFDGIVVPGGALHVDQLRSSEAAIDFIRHFLEEGKPIATFDHGVEVLISTGEVSGLHLTSLPYLKRDFIYAGAHWVEANIEIDHGLITGQGSDHLGQFCEKLVLEFTSELHPSHVRLPRTLQSQVLH